MKYVKTEDNAPHTKDTPVNLVTVNYLNNKTLKNRRNVTKHFDSLFL